jgi:uncharacterized protein YkwD
VLATNFLDDLKVAFDTVLFLAIVGGIIWILFTPAQVNTLVTSGNGDWNETAIEQTIHEEVNERRVAAGSPEIGYSDTLHGIADAHSEDMAKRGYYEHTSPEGDDFTDRYEAAGYDCHVNDPDGVDSGGAENIDKTILGETVLVDGREVSYDTEQQAAVGVVNQWINSSEHREILLREDWNVEGVGVAINDSAMYVTQNFC